MLKILLSLLLIITTMPFIRAQSAPNCRDINVSVDAFGLGTFAPEDLITNVTAGFDSVDLQLRNSLDHTVWGPERVAIIDQVEITACKYIDRSLKAFVSTDFGGCWSQLTFKKDAGPVIEGRTFNVYCYDSLAKMPDAPPTVINVCDPSSVLPQYVADWIYPYECVQGIQDTAKLILREWELYDKDGHRSTGFDTIVVYKIPQIVTNNIYCGEGDTIYCSNLDSLVGPYISIPEIPLDVGGTCLDIPLIDFSDADEDGVLEITRVVFDEKCGLDIHVDTERFDVDCEIQYRITIDVKQSCYGAAQTSCSVPVPAGTSPNVMENVVPGYWRCVFWIRDLDTLPPTLHCKDPVLFSGEFDLANWVDTTEGDAFIDYEWDPYHLVLGSNDAGGTDSVAEVCLTLSRDTVIAFAWEYHSENADAAYDPFGYVHNGTFYRLTKGEIDVEDGPVNQDGYSIVELRAGDTFCFSQRSTDGIFGRAVTTIKPLTIVTTSGESCVAHTYVPDVNVTDDWSGIKTVKATVLGYGTFVLTYSAEKECYESHERIALPHSADAYKIYYEASDSCHNTILDTCYLLVKDRTRPTAVIDKGVSVTLSGKKVWMDALTLNEGSSDNCDLNILVARRADWYEACVDLCDDREPVCINEHGDTLWKAILQTDKDKNEAEAHYNQQLWDWREDNRPCANLLYNAWMYDLIKHGTFRCDTAYHQSEEEVMKFIQSCSEAVEDYFQPVILHPDPYKLSDTVAPENDFKFDRRLFDVYQQIGGGWSDAVPFDCDDACSAVTVEVLVMDYWCNWSKAWTNVWVEDKTPAKVIKDVEDIEITCKIYRTPKYLLEGTSHPLSIASIVDLAKEKDDNAFKALDAIFGGYQKVWEGPYDQYYDTASNHVMTEIPFVDSSCYCRFDSVTRTYTYDDHLGTSYWKLDSVYECGYEEVLDTFNQGLVLANCAGLVDCSQRIWCDIDHCGEGYLYREFKIWQGCPPHFYYDDQVSDSLKQAHIPDTIVRKQRIKIYNECALEKQFFKVPKDVELQVCGIEYNVDGSGKVAGAAHPDQTGWMSYRFDDDCRLVGIAYDDQVYKVVGGDAGCYKIKRTWYFMDWCEGQPADVYWYKDYSLDIDSCEQLILLYDTVPPLCQINGPVEDGGTIEAGACTYDFEADLSVSDVCGVTSYTWQLLDITEVGDPLLLDVGSGYIDSLKGSISSDDLLPGDYKLKVEVVDACNNEGTCTYFFTVKGTKKPSAICLTLITAVLSPIDLDQDGLVDTSIATIWAAEVDQSSSWICGDTAIELRLEHLDGIEDDVLGGEGDSLNFGCEHQGNNRIRMWVISHPSGTYDYCDVSVIVQNNGVGCSIDEPVENLPKHFDAGNRISQHPVRRPEIPIRIIAFNVPGDASDNDLKGEIGRVYNYPNPFRDHTTVEFFLPEDTDAYLTILDITGQIVYQVQGGFVKGQNRVMLGNKEIGGPGIKYVQLQAGEVVATRKMISLQ